MSMKMVSPMAISGYTVNVTETDAAVYVAGTTYTINALVMYNHRVYSSLQATNVGHQPDTSPTWWLDNIATNAYRAIDSSSSSKTTGTNLIFNMASGKSSCVALLGVTATSVTVEILNESLGVIYTNTIIGTTRNLSTWYEWFTGSFINKTSFIFDTIFYPTGTIRITLAGASSCSNIIIGTKQDLGCVNWDAGTGFIDYSIKSTDQWGNTYLKQGNYINKLDVTLNIPTIQYDAIRSSVIAKRGIPSLFIGADNTFDSTTIYGFIREFDPVLKNPAMSLATLRVEGLL